MFAVSRDQVRLLGAAMAVILAVACSDLTRPTASRVRGTYELSTVLETLTYSSSCLPTPNGVQCTDSTVDAGSSKLYGSFTIGDEIPGPAGYITLAMTGADIHMSDCGISTSPCTETVAPFTSGSASVNLDSREFSAPIYGAALVALHGTLGNGEISGSVQWHTYLGCCAVRYYSGTFVAKQHKRVTSPMIIPDLLPHPTS